MFVFSLLPSTVHDLIGHIGFVVTAEAESDQSEVRLTGVGGAWAEACIVRCKTGSAGSWDALFIYLIPHNIPGRFGPLILLNNSNIIVSARLCSVDNGCAVISEGFISDFSNIQVVVH